MTPEDINFQISLDARTDPETGKFVLNVTIDADSDPTTSLYSYTAVEKAIRTAALTAWYNAWDAAAHVMNEHRGDAVAQLERVRVQVTRTGTWEM